MIRLMSGPTLLSLSAFVALAACTTKSEKPADTGMAVDTAAATTTTASTATTASTTPTASSTASTNGAVVFPININTATDAEILAIPGMGPRMLREFKEYRPYTSIAQFRREIGKYVDKTEVARLEKYIVIK